MTLTVLGTEAQRAKSFFKGMELVTESWDPNANLRVPLPTSHVPTLACLALEWKIGPVHLCLAVNT